MIGTTMPGFVTTPFSMMMVFFTIRAANTPVRFMMPTRDRSMPPAIMQAIMPRASTPYSGNWKIMDRRFSPVK